MKPLRQLSAADYAALLQSGKLWELYPDATGDYARDTRPMSLYELAEAMRDAYRTFALEDARRIVADLYGKHFDKAIMAEGFTAKQAEVIGYAAYERGHSCEEIVRCAMDVCEFAKSLLAAK